MLQKESEKKDKTFLETNMMILLKKRLREKKEAKLFTQYAQRVQHTQERDAEDRVKTMIFSRTNQQEDLQQKRLRI